MNYKRNEKLIKAFGKHVRKLRTTKGLSMEKLADLADIEYSQIYKIEHGEINTTISTSHALAKALDIELYALFMFEIAKK
ncbi:MAG: helix-turn-helix domain-containing protein [Bacteroidia bacterium]